MRVLCIGDVFAEQGVNALLNILPSLKKKERVDLCIVNGENSSNENGIDRYSADRIFAAGADLITGGNHTLKLEEIYSTLDENPFMIRPANLKTDIGKGYALLDMGKYSVAVINLIGRIFLEKIEAENPFDTVDSYLERAKADNAKYIIVDFHAEATSEKRAMGFYLDGKVSAVFGTHTHVQTNDACVLPLGSGYITDLGMTGVKDSVLGVKKEIIVNRLKNKDMSKFYPATGDCIVSGAVFELDEKTGLCSSAKEIRIEL
ncbi:MAG: YmdB family metallophosphoesterase [Clostridia bacterium]|nr:YmdB family metallophosphoesterase [Clostridia bacterium]